MRDLLAARVSQVCSSANRLPSLNRTRRSCVMHAARQTPGEVHRMVRLTPSVSVLFANRGGRCRLREHSPRRAGTRCARTRLEQERRGGVRAAPAHLRRAPWALPGQRSRPRDRRHTRRGRAGAPEELRPGRRAGAALRERKSAGDDGRERPRARDRQLPARKGSVALAHERPHLLRRRLPRAAFAGILSASAVLRTRLKSWCPRFESGSRHTAAYYSARR